MNKITKLLTILLLCCTAATLSAQGSDSVIPQEEKQENISIHQILDAFNGQSISELKQKIDFLIEAGEDSTEQAFIAYYIFDYYSRSKIMGYEECALYVADEYFLNGKLKTENESIYMAMKMFAEFNRQSMIGMSAPQLEMEDRSGHMRVLPEGNYKYTLLYFYDDDCSSCRIQTPAIMNYLSLFYQAQIHVYRIYTQKDFGKWQSYIRELDEKYPCPANVSIEDVWDPEINSDFPRKYNVISTPQLYLLNEKHQIIGRKLDAEALMQLIEIQQNQPGEFEIFFDKIFKKMISPDPEIGLDVEYAHKILEAFYRDSHSQPWIYDEIFYNLYLYLKRQNDYELQELAVYLAEEYILSRQELWKDAIFSPTERTEDDGILVGDYTDIEDFMAHTAAAVDLFKRNPLGEPCQDLILRDARNRKISIYQTEAEYTVLYFYSLDCAVCDAVELEMQTIYQKFKSRDVQFLAINTGKDKSAWKKHIRKNKTGWIEAWDPKRESDLFRKYDLSQVPAIYILDRDKYTLAKDIPSLALNNLLEYLLPEAEPQQ